MGFVAGAFSPFIEVYIDYRGQISIDDTVLGIRDFQQAVRGQQTNTNPENIGILLDCVNSIIELIEAAKNNSGMEHGAQNPEFPASLLERLKASSEVLKTLDDESGVFLQCFNGIHDKLACFIPQRPESGEVIDFAAEKAKRSVDAPPAYIA